MLAGGSMGLGDGGNMPDAGVSMGDAVLGCKDDTGGIIAPVGGGGSGPVLSVGTVGSIPMVVRVDSRDGGREA